MHTVHTEADMYSRMHRVHAFKCTEDSKREMVNDSIQSTITAQAALRRVLLATI